MTEDQCVLMVSGIMFCIGIYGIVLRRSLTKIIISIDAIILSAVLNFCYFSRSSGSGELASAVAIVISGIFFCVALTLISLKVSSTDTDDDMLDLKDMK